MLATRPGFGELPLGAVLAIVRRERLGTGIVARALGETPQPEAAQPERIEGSHAEDARIVRDGIVDEGLDIDGGERFEHDDGLLETTLGRQPTALEPRQLVVAVASPPAAFRVRVWQIMLR
jgi:hypothetical protein